MAAVETALSRESSPPVAPPGRGRALILAGRLEQKSAEESYRKAASNRTRLIAERTGPGAVQRLARRLRPNGKAALKAPRKTLPGAGFKPDELVGSWIGARPVGRPACNPGYPRRGGSHQVVSITEEMQRIILRDGSALEVTAQAQAEGTRSLRQSCRHEVKMDLTSLEEVVAVTNE